MNNPNKKLLSIKEAAKYLGITEMTLRRWDKDGSFKPTFVSPGKHRYYSLSDLEKKTKGIFRLAEEWVIAEKSFTPEDEFYCATRDVFKARYDKIANELSAKLTSGSLIASAAGEIGNNSFDHNLGNWPDISGILFAYDMGKRRIVLADRGVGILNTLQKVIPKLEDDKKALEIAFTEVITGRAPEHRGNGLKYTKAAIIEADAKLLFQSGDAMLEINKNDSLNVKDAKTPIQGCLAMIEF